MIKRILVMVMAGMMIGVAFASEVEIDDISFVSTEEVVVEDVVIGEIVEEQILNEIIDTEEQIERSVSIRISCPDIIYIGDNVTLYAVLKGYENTAYHIQWQVSKNNSNWKDISGANDEKYTVTITEENRADYYRVAVTVE